MFSCEYFEISKNTYFEEHLQTGSSVLLIIKLVISIGHLFLIKNMTWMVFFLNQKHDVGWFLLIRFVDLIRLYSLLIISRNHSNTLTCRKIEVKLKIEALMS